MVVLPSVKVIVSSVPAAMVPAAGVVPAASAISATLESVKTSPPAAGVTVATPDAVEIVGAASAAN
ncbi:MAG: hypothetical protein IJ667_13065 [Synergistaceae bacterium]|nr:hypothetical protein [Synergistaceae bacterium]